MSRPSAFPPLRIVERGRAIVGVGIAAGIVGACALPHDMERAAPVQDSCPAEAPGTTGDLPDSTTLRWYRAAQGRDRDLAARWCATVGAPVIRLQPSSTAAVAWTAGRPLELVTWNMAIGGGDLLRFLSERLGVDCGPDAPVPASDPPPFVLMLQEVWRYEEGLPEVGDDRIIPLTIDPGREEGRDFGIDEAAARCGLALVYVPSARNGPDSGTRPSEDKGNALLANVPLTTPMAFDLPLEGGRKVAVGADVRAPGGERVRVVSVHLDVASTLVRTLMSGNQTRVRQASGLLDGLEEAKRDGPSDVVEVVGGDFNTWAGNESTLQLLRAAFPESAAWDRLGSRGRYPTDHIFFRGTAPEFSIAAYQRIDDPYGSDHQARRMALLYEGASPGR